MLHTFTGAIDGATPYAGLTWDGGANLYGTAAIGGYTGATCYGTFGQQVNGCGTVYRLHQSGGKGKVARRTASDCYPDHD